jgi:hypothetical protein
MLKLSGMITPADLGNTLRCSLKCKYDVWNKHCVMLLVFQCTIPVSLSEYLAMSDLDFAVMGEFSCITLSCDIRF